MLKDLGHLWRMGVALTLADIARKLKLPESTVRYRAKLFDEYLPYFEQGKTKFYADHALEIFQRISEWFSEGLHRTEIQERLAQEYPMALEVSEFPMPQQASTQELPDLLGQLVKGFHSLVQGQNRRLERLEEEDRRVEALIQRLREEEEKRRLLRQRADEIIQMAKRTIDQQRNQSAEHEQSLHERDREIDRLRADLERERQKSWGHKLLEKLGLIST